jgi:hypothetical protein
MTLAIPWTLDLPVDLLFSTPRAAADLGETPATLRAWRRQNVGPRYILYDGRTVKYPLRELDAYRVRAGRAQAAANNVIAFPIRDLTPALAPASTAQSWTLC